MFLFQVYYRFLLLSVIKALVTVQILRNSVYHSNSSCAFLGNLTLANDATLQTCIWECVHEHDCQTAVYFGDKRSCSMFSEFWEAGRVESVGNIRASVICYRKSHNPVVTCSPTTEPTQEETTTLDENIATTSVQITPTSTAETNDTVVNSSYYYRLTNLLAGPSLALDVDTSSSYYHLITAPITNFTNQFWRFDPSINNGYKISTRFFNYQYSLDIINIGNGTISSEPHMATTGYYSGQCWHLSPVGGRAFMLSNDFTGSSKYLDVYPNTFIPFMSDNSTDYRGTFWIFTKIEKV